MNEELKRKATSSTLIGGLALASLLIGAEQYLLATVVYGVYAAKEAVVWWAKSRKETGE
jgi:hypothetical protein